jgi:hypothetical protein
MIALDDRPADIAGVRFFIRQVSHLFFLRRLSDELFACLVESHPRRIVKNELYVSRCFARIAAADVYDGTTDERVPAFSEAVPDVHFDSSSAEIAQSSSDIAKSSSSSSNGEPSGQCPHVIAPSSISMSSMSPPQ